jgi:isopenicillin N synthase-like dioxygenase
MEITQVSLSKVGLAASNPTSEDFSDCGRQLYNAFSKIGFVYLCDHGIDDSVITAALESSRCL